MTDTAAMAPPRIHIPRWPLECDRTIRRLTTQLVAVPELAERYLTPVPASYTEPSGRPAHPLVRRMPLPPAG